MYIRTMFWHKVESLKVIIDGVIYEFSTAANGECFNQKEALFMLNNYVDPGTMEMDFTFDNFIPLKKELIKMCKDWDKQYMKHAKSIWPEINEIHMKAMKPLNQLIEANANFHLLEKMIAEKKEVP